MHLINQTTLLVDAKDDLKDRVGMIDGGTEMLDSLCHQVCTAVIQNVQLFIFLEIDHVVLPVKYKNVLYEGRWMRGTTLFPIIPYERLSFL